MIEIASCEISMKTYLKVFEKENDIYEIVKEYSDGEKLHLMVAIEKQTALALFCGICSHFMVPSSQKSNIKSISNSIDRAYWIYTEDGKKRNKGA